MKNKLQLEREISRIEGFPIELAFDGESTAPKRLGSYEAEYQRRARNSFTVADFTRARIAALYPGFSIRVILPTGKIAPKTMKLQKLRDLFAD